MKSYFLVFYSLRRPIMNNLQEKVIRAIHRTYAERAFVSKTRSRVFKKNYYSGHDLGRRIG